MIEKSEYIEFVKETEPFTRETFNKRHVALLSSGQVEKYVENDEKSREGRNKMRCELYVCLYKYRNNWQCDDYFILPRI